MSTLYMMATISDRNQARRFLAFYKEHGITMTLITFGRGTTSSEILDSFGLEAAEKAVLFSFVTDSEWGQIKNGLQKQMKIDIPGSGIAFIVPISSVGGKKQLQFLTEGREFKKGDESILKNTKYELLVVIANQGYTDMVMDAARTANAAGGTVIHAKGTGTEHAERFLGVSIAAEKEMIFMVTKREGKNAVMKAVMDKAGINSRAGSIVFSLPVTETAGMRLIEDELEP